MWNTVYAMGAGGTGQSDGGSSIFSSMLPLLLMIGVIYFILIRPQQRKAKLHQEFLNQIKKGDEVMTSSGIFGRVAGTTDAFVTLEIAKETKIKVSKSHISGKAPTESENKPETGKN